MHLGHVWVIIWGMSWASSGACLGHYLGQVLGIIWGIIWGMSGPLSGACLGHHLGHHLGHVWGISWGMSGAKSEGMSGAVLRYSRCYMHLWCRYLLLYSMYCQQILSKVTVHCCWDCLLGIPNIYLYIHKNQFWKNQLGIHWDNFIAFFGDLKYWIVRFLWQFWFFFFVISDSWEPEFITIIVT